eukprot:3543625-Rhodomonas_salina.1
MVPIAKEQLFTKWEVVYKEQWFAKAFAKACRSRRWTRAEANAGGDGGVPSDNNSLEAKNGVIKKGLRREQPVITSMLPRSLSWLSDDSVRYDSSRPGAGSCLCSPSCLRGGAASTTPRAGTPFPRPWATAALRCVAPLAVPL